MRLIALLLGAALVLLAGACRSLPGGAFVARQLGGEAPSGGRITEQELRAALVQFASRFEATVVSTADAVAAASDDPEIDRLALLWKLRLVPVANEAAFLPEPEAAYVALLALTTSMHDYVTTGAGAARLGEHQPIVVEATAGLLAEAKRVGEEFLTRRQVARVSAEVEKLVDQRPIRGDFVTESIQSLVASTQSSATFDWVTAVPLSPFRALQGVDQGAQAIRELNDTALHLGRIASTLPKLARWNLELLALDLGGQPKITAGLASFESLARSAETLSQTAQTLPESISALLAEAERTGRSLAPFAESLERTAAAVATAGNAWGGLVEQVGQRPEEPASRPFDILEWERTAAQVSTAAAELRTLIEALDAFAASDALAAPLAELSSRVERVETGTRALVDHAALRLLEIVLACFLLLFLYRRLEAWLARRAASR